MKLIALDTVQVTSVKSEPLVRNEKFETDEDTARSLIRRGLASKDSPGKAAPAPRNKAEPAPPNKES